jgi:hypothetical protein
MLGPTGGIVSLHELPDAIRFAELSTARSSSTADRRPRDLKTSE